LKAGVYRIHFRYGSKQYHKSLLTDDETKAQSLKATIDETLHDLKRGRVTLPPDADFWTFVFSGGKLTQLPSAPDPLTLEELFTRYEELLPPGALEANSLATYHLHKGHLLRGLGGKRAAQSLTLTDVQGYANRRSKEKYRGRLISPATIRKELASLRAVWNAGARHQLVTGTAPVKGVKFDKAEQAPPFLTWQEVKRRIAKGGDAAELWDCLFLDTQQVGEVLDYVKEHAAFPFIYPMFVFVAHTGARRSEMIRSQVDDLDFAAGEVVLREKKRDRSVKLTFRRVTMSAHLKEVMQAWLRDGHPGGPYTFGHGDVVPRSRKRSKTTGHQNPKGRATSYKGRMATVHERTERLGHEPLTPKEATHHFRQTLAGGKWDVLRGFHVFRHSFASNLARAGVDQREIDALLGHTTEEMRRRYRHLFPEQRDSAIKKLFG
jgi:integrase